MSFEELMGLCAILTTMIVIASMIAGVYKQRLAFKERRLESMAGDTAEKAAQYAARTTTLENRVRVLERIITDGGSSSDIALQIEALRDQRVEVTTQ